MTDQISVLAGVGADAPIEIKPNGAKQSAVPYRFDLIDAGALFVLGRILDYGERKYGANNWRGLSVEDHVNHLLIHAYSFLAGDKQDDHIGHMFARSMMALAVAMAGGYVPKQSDEVPA